MSKRRIFLSYGHDRYASFAERLKRDLKGLGHDVWFDAERLKPGVDWERYVEQGLAWAAEPGAAGCVVLLMTPHSVRRPDGYCLNELARATSKKIPIIPVMLAACEPPLSIARTQWLDMQGCAEDEPTKPFEPLFERLLDALEHENLDFEGAAAALLHLLSPPDFSADIRDRLKHFVGREWLFALLRTWLDEPNGSRLFWITGGPGVGKSALAAQIAQRFREIAAFHACVHGNTSKADPRRVLMSIAYQLATQLPDYMERLARLDLARVCSESNAQTLFDSLLVQPFAAGFPAPDRTLALVIDALDEATQQGENELAGLIAREFPRTPPWLRLVVTSRPEKEVRLPLQGFSPFVLTTASEENRNDVRIYLGRELERLSPGGVAAETLDAIIDRSEGVFLYVVWVIREFDAGRLRLESVEKFPQGLGGIYLDFFQRQFIEPEGGQNWIAAYEQQYLPVLELLASAFETLRVEYVAAVLNWEPRDQAKVLSALGSLFPVESGIIRPFHLSVLDWLRDPDKAGPELLVDARSGHRRHAMWGLTQWREGDLGRRSRYSRDWREFDAYWLEHLAAHLYDSGDHERLQRLIDKSWMQARCSTSSFTYGRFLQDVDLAWRAAAQANDVVALARLAMTRRLVSQKVTALTDTDLKTLVWLGRNDEALGHARLRASAVERCRGLITIDEAERTLPLIDQGQSSTRSTEIEMTMPGHCDAEGTLVNEALREARSITLDSDRTTALLAVTGAQAEAGRFEEALATAHLVPDTVQHARAIAAVAALMATIGDERVTTVFDEALTVARSIIHERDRASVIAAVAGMRAHVADVRTTSLFHEALTVARAIADETVRVHTLAAVAESQMNAAVNGAMGLFDEAMTIAGSITSSDGRALALARVAESLARLGSERATVVLDETLNCARSVENRPLRSWALREAVDSMTRAGRSDLAFKAALVFSQEFGTSEALAMMADALSGAGRFDEALVTARTIRDQAVRANALSEIARALARADRIEAALNTASTIEDPQVRGRTLGEVAAVLGRAGRFDVALETTRQINDEQCRVDTLKEVACSLAQARDERAASVFEEAARAISNAREQRAAVTAVAAAVAQAGRLDIVSAVAAAITDDKTLVTVLIALAEAQARAEDDRAASVFDRALEVACAMTGYDGSAAVIEVVNSLIHVKRFEKALDAARFSATGYTQGEALCAVASALARADRFDEALAATRHFTSGHHQAKALIEVAKSLARAGHADRAFKIAQATAAADESGKARVLAAAAEAQARPGDDRSTRAFDDALEAARAIADDSGQASALKEVAEALAKVGRVEEALETARSIPPLRAHQVFTPVIAALVRAGRLDEALEAAHAISPWSALDRADAFLTVIAALARAGRLEQALDAIRAMNDWRFEAGAFGRVAGALADAGRFEEALSTLPAGSPDAFLEDVANWARAFEKVAPGLSVSVLRETIAVAGWVRPDWQNIYELLAST
jgi:tetratricopeptide (TPR) repeat protein